jgi:hypothetical protein
MLSKHTDTAEVPSLVKNCRQICIFRFPSSTVMTAARGRESGGLRKGARGWEAHETETKTLKFTFDYYHYRKHSVSR